MNELALFAGAGGGILGGVLLGWRTVGAVEINAYCARRLMQRQNEGLLPSFPIWDDVCSFDGRPWKGIVDVVSGGFPCTDISTCRGRGRLGINGIKSGLWKEMFRIVCEVQPRFIFMENSAALINMGLSRILGEMASMGYNAKWGVFSAADFGARHERARIWIIGYRDTDQDSASAGGFWDQSHAEPLRNMQKIEWPAEYRMDRMADGLATWMERHAAIGNGQVPAVVFGAWNALMMRKLSNIVNHAGCKS